MKGTGTNDTDVIGTYCGQDPPVVSTDTNKITVVFKSDALYRYQGFKCRFRAIQPNGIAVINSFGDGSDSGKQGCVILWLDCSANTDFIEVYYLDSGAANQVVYANNFFSGQPSHCQDQVAHQGDQASNGDDPNYAGANLFGGLWSGTCGTSNIFKSQNRIVGGEETIKHQFPWMVYLFQMSPSWTPRSEHPGLGLS